MLAMQKLSKQQRLFIRRTIVCLCLSLILYLMVEGALLVVHAITGKSCRPGREDAVAAVRATAFTASGVKDFPGNNTAAPKSAAWFQDAVFIGDSRTQGLENYDGLSGAAYYAIKGLMVDTVYTKQELDINGKKLTVMQAMQRKKFGKIYIMFGINELGWSSMQTFLNDYGTMIDDLRKYQPQAKIYVQSILPVSAQKSASDKIYNNTRINTFNQAIEKLCADRKVRYLTVNKAVSDSGGFLPQEASSDGVHLNSSYCKKWCEYLKAHTD